MKKLMQLLRENAAKERKPLNLVRAEGSDVATLYIYDVIDAYWGVSAIDVAKAIAGLGKDVELHLRVNTPGGDVFEARAIKTAIEQHAGRTVAHIDGLCASAGTAIVSGADEVEIVAGGFYMIHNAWTFAMGDKNAMRETAALLDKIDEVIVSDYTKRTGKTAAEVIAWMDAETWFTAEQAVEHGFADRLAESAEKSSAKASAWNLAVFENTPKDLLAPVVPAAQDPAVVRAANQRRLRLLQID
jgi:ATP-dependent Clp protease, protease subunit